MSILLSPLRVLLVLLEFLIPSARTLLSTPAGSCRLLLLSAQIFIQSAHPLFFLTPFFLLSSVFTLLPLVFHLSWRLRNGGTGGYKPG